MAWLYGFGLWVHRLHLWARCICCAGCQLQLSCTHKSSPHCNNKAPQIHITPHPAAFTSSDNSRKSPKIEKSSLTPLFWWLSGVNTMDFHLLCVKTHRAFSFSEQAKPFHSKTNVDFAIIIIFIAISSSNIICTHAAVGLCDLRQWGSKATSDLYTFMAALMNKSLTESVLSNYNSVFFTACWDKC